MLGAHSSTLLCGQKAHRAACTQRTPVNTQQRHTFSGSGMWPSSASTQRAPSHTQQRHICNASSTGGASYASTSINERVLRLPPRTELQPQDYTRIYGYSDQLEKLYFVGRVVGAGSFGVVRECVEISSGKRYAIKSIPKKPKRGPSTPRYLLKVRGEVEIMQQLGFSLDAANLREVFEDPRSVHLVMDLCEGGALLERVSSRQYSEKYIARLARSILRFVSQCHAKGIIYRDIKPDNFLFVDNSQDSQLKAIDFGLSIRHWPSEPKLTSRSGTPAYMSPELVLQNYDEKCDIWGVGMLTFQLLTGRFPYWDDVRSQSLTDVWRSILGQDIDWEAPYLKGLSPAAMDFLKTLLRRKPEDRPSASQALEHPWIRDGGFAPELPLEGTVVQRLQRFSTYGKLKQVVLSIIAEELAGSHEPTSQPLAAISSVQDLFEDIDTDGSGGVSLEELTAGLTKQGYKLTPDEIEQLLRGIDANYDGQIDLNEFLTTLLDWDELQKQQTWESHIDFAFNKIDADGDGFISLEELLDLIPAPPRGAAGGEAERQVEARAMLREADSNEDGKISREEFYSLLKDVQAPDTLALYDHRLPPSKIEELAAKA